jgi:putative nucleotidyltransferase with HDIG domain
MRFRKTSPRRQAIREDKPSVRTPGHWWSSVRVKMGLVAFTFFIAACALQFWTGDPLPYRMGELAPMDLRAPVDFTIVDTVRTESLRDAARLTSPPVLVADPAYLEKVHNQLTALKADIGPARNLSEVPPEIQKRFPGLNDAAVEWMHSPEAARFESMVQTFMSLGMPAVPPRISSSDRDLLLEKNPVEAALAFTPSLEGLVSIPVQQIQVADPATGATVLPPTSRPLQIAREVVETEPGAADSAAATRPAFGTEPATLEKLRPIVSVYFTQDLATPITRFLLQLNEPTFRYSPKLTVALADRTASLIAPIGRKVYANSIIVRRSQLITWDIFQQLREAQAAMARTLADENPLAAWFTRLGRALVVLILTLAGVLYIARLAHTRMTVGRAWAICGLLLFTLLVAKAVVWSLPQTLYLMGLAPTLLTAIILVIAFNQRFALGISSIHALLVTLTLGQNVDFFLTLLTGILIFCFGLGEIRTRGKLIQVGFFASAAIYVAVWALGLAQMVGQVWSPWIGTTDFKFVGFIHGQSLWAACSGVAVAMFALAVLPSIERVFKITTAMTLLELCDANKPLLVRLSQEAPGTFNHSLTVGIMAEAAGNAIGANGLLCRVGAYYHDVGKLSKPQYFIENQAAGHPNRHDKLSPAMSLLIIVGHVKDGIELAREYALPWVVHQFIAQHHGTTLVEYFYHAARKRAEKNEDAAIVSETEFRYPGPRPQTPEAAIVMICDSCESTVRAIEEPTPGRIESAVHNMIMKRLLDGQFSECDLTLRDLSIVEETLTRTLAGIHHGRVAYPGRGEEPVSSVGLSQPA